MAENYREIYKEYYGEYPEDFEIHHINFNHDDNDLGNLVALPKMLHRRLHKCYLAFGAIKGNCSLNDIKLYSGGNMSQVYFMDILTEYVNVIQECKKYMTTRDLKRLYKGVTHG